MDRAKTEIEAANDAMIHPQAWQEMSLSAFCNEKEAAALSDAIAALPFDRWEWIFIVHGVGESPLERIVCHGAAFETVICDRTWRTFSDRMKNAVAEQVVQSITSKVQALPRFGRIAILETIHRFYVYQSDHGPDTPADALDDTGVCFEKSNHRRLQDARFWREWA